MITEDENRHNGQSEAVDSLEAENVERRCRRVEESVDGDSSKST